LVECVRLPDAASLPCRFHYPRGFVVDFGVEEEGYFVTIWDHLSPQEQRALCAIINRAKQIQTEYAVIAVLKEKAVKYKAELIDICRKCTDENCADNGDCEVKKAYDNLVKVNE